jgi:regulator of nucleoside diphosphate kinase
MSAASSTERIFSELDRVRIERLAARFPTADGLPHAVLDGFDEGDFLMPSDIPEEITICYPSEADAPKGFISVLSPVGGHLLGHRVGATVSWVDASGAAATLHIEALLFQPEASGELAL